MWCGPPEDCLFLREGNLWNHRPRGVPPRHRRFTSARGKKKIVANIGKLVYKCLPRDEWGEFLPIRVSFRHGYPLESVIQVKRR